MNTTNMTTTELLNVIRNPKDHSMGIGQTPDYHACVEEACERLERTNRMHAVSEKDRNPELDYTEGGLHRIIGTCTHVDRTADEHDMYVQIDAENGNEYVITVPKAESKYASHPPEQKPVAHQPCVLLAEQLEQHTENPNTYTGYAEITYVPETTEELDGLRQIGDADNPTYAIIEA